MVWHWLTIFGTWVYHHDKMCRVHSWSRYDLELWPQGQIYRVFDMFSCPAHNFFMVWHWHTIFRTWMYHHETMCRVHSWSRYDLEFWPQGQNYRVFDMFSCPAHNFLAHLSWKLKWAFLITCCPSSVCLSVCLSVCKLFTFSSSSPEPLGQFQPGEGDLSLFKWRAPPFSKGR